MKHTENEITLHGSYITPEELANRLDRSIHTVYKMIANGRIPGVIKRGRLVLIPVNALPIDKRRFKRSKDPGKSNMLRKYLFVYDGVEVWAERGNIYLWVGSGVEVFQDTPEERNRIVEMAKDSF